MLLVANGIGNVSELQCKDLGDIRYVVVLVLLHVRPTRSLLFLSVHLVPKRVSRNGITHI